MIESLSDGRQDCPFSPPRGSSGWGSGGGPCQSVVCVPSSARKCAMAIRCNHIHSSARRRGEGRRWRYEPGTNSTFRGAQPEHPRRICASRYARQKAAMPPGRRGAARSSVRGSRQKKGMEKQKIGRGEGVRVRARRGGVSSPGLACGREAFRA